MKVDVKKVDAVKRELRFEVPKERVAQTFEEVYKDIGKAAKIKGFRPGKAPRHMIESRHAQLAQEEVIKDLIPKVYHEGISQENITPLDLPEIMDVHLKDGILTFTAKLDIKPEVEIKDYKGIKVHRKDTSVTEEEIKKVLEYYQKGHGKDQTVELDDQFARGLGYPSLEDFKKNLIRQLEMDKDRQNRLDVEHQILEHLLSKSKLVTPPSLVKKQLERRMAELKHRARSQGISDEDIKKRDEASRKELEEAVEREVRIYLICDKIAQLEKIEIHENENMVGKVMELLLKEAKWS